MRSFFAALVVTGVVAAARPAVTPASDPLDSDQTTPYPGQMTQARVWVQNRGRAEAVPVDLRDVNVETPLRVQVVNGEVGSRAPNPALVRLGHQQWEYATVAVAPGAQATAVLNERGTDGWETTGIAWTTGDGTTLLLKRPR